MLNHFFHMVSAIVIFFIVLSVYMLILFYYRKYRKEHHLLQGNFFKLSFIFAALYFSLFVLFHHTGIHCEDLDKATQCQCYALEVANRNEMKQKMDWAHQGAQMCPDSRFFSDFLKAHEAFEKQAELLHRKMSTPMDIHLVETQGVATQDLNACLQLADTLIDGEHFIAANNIPLSKGLYYLSFEAMPTKTQLFIYIVGEKASILFPWLNSPQGTPDWTSFGDTASLKPIFSEKKTSWRKEKLGIIIESLVDQKIQLRWQHGQTGGTIYQGKKGNVSKICHVAMSQIMEGVV